MYRRLIYPREAIRAEYVGDVDARHNLCSAGHSATGWPCEPIPATIPEGAGDFVWTWQSDLLITSEVRDAFLEAGFDGWGARPVRAHNTDREWWELRRTGDIVDAEESAGHTLTDRCGVCGRERHTFFTHPERMLNQDHGDFLVVWPVPMWVIAHDRVVQVIRRRGFRGVEVRNLENHQGDLLAPGPRGLWMPSARP